jgi:uncharacterized Fe-S cluster-containing radical SAM superfamily protein
MYDPIEVTKKVEPMVVDQNRKKYYRFRPTGFYGGIATADTVGCNLRCKFCWSGNSVWNAANTGEFYSPEEVVVALQAIAENKGYHQVRISGGEPTIGKQHLIEVLTRLKSKYTFILETNGILLGYEKSYVEDLSCFEHLHVRVCLKGADAEEFSLFTGAKLGFDYQLNALQYLHDFDMNFNIAVVSVHTEKKRSLFKRLKQLGLDNVMIEEEEIQLYPMVQKRLQQEQLLDLFQPK